MRAASVDILGDLDPEVDIKARTKLRKGTQRWMVKELRARD